MSQLDHIEEIMVNVGVYVAPLYFELTWKVFYARLNYISFMVQLNLATTGEYNPRNMFEDNCIE